MDLPAYANRAATFPEMYERWLVPPLFRPWAEILLDRAALSAGDSVLDIACGTGIVARLAKARVGDSGRVVGVDLSPAMLDVSRGIEAGVDWREGNAGALPVGEGDAFDAVICQQGIQFFPDKPAAAREMRRVLKPGGRLVVATWRSADEMPLCRETQRVAERHVGPIIDQRYAFGDEAALTSLLQDAGFHEVRVETVSRTVRFSDPAVFIRLNAMALVGMSGAKLTDEERVQVVGVVANDTSDVLPPFLQGGELVFELISNVATARG